jgi:hypothetical protein
MMTSTEEEELWFEAEGDEVADTNDDETDRDDEGDFLALGGESFDVLADDSLAKEYFAALSATSNQSYQKTIRFSYSVKFSDEVENNSYKESVDNGVVTEDSLVFLGNNNNNNNNNNSSSSNNDIASSTQSITKENSPPAMNSKESYSTDSESEEDDEDEEEEDDELDKDKEQEKQIVKSLLFGALGFGIFTLATIGAKKLISVFSKSSNENPPSPTDHLDLVQGATSSGTPTTTTVTPTGLDQGVNELTSQAAQQLATDGVANASMTASQGNMSSLAGGFYAPPPGMQGAQ